MTTTPYLDAAEQVARWIETTTLPQAHGASWPSDPLTPEPSDISLYAGSCGVVLFYLEAYRTTGDAHHLELAKAGARWIISMIPTDENLGLFTGTAGAGWVLHQLARATGDEEAVAGAALAVQHLRSTANDDGVTANWLELTEYVWGTAGIALFLLEYARDTSDASVRDLAARAGRWLVTQARKELGGGESWRLGEGARTFMGNRADIIFPNFSHGTAGIAFALASIGEETDHPEMIEHAVAGATWILSIARTDDDGCAAFHYANEGSDTYHYGWCHGPTGLAPLFHRLHLATADDVWSGWTRRAARTVRTSGLPERKYPGFWDNVARCCGSAGVADLFLDLHRVSGEQDDLDFAIAVTDDILARATVDETGMRWSNIEFRTDPPALPPETGFMQGASGIGTLLLRLHRYLNGEDASIRLPHSPF